MEPGALGSEGRDLTAAPTPPPIRGYHKTINSVILSIQEKSMDKEYYSWRHAQGIEKKSHQRHEWLEVVRWKHSEH